MIDIKLKGKSNFLVLWGGQFISLLGSSMTQFALLVWAYKMYGTASSVAMLGFASYLPYILLSPIAGVIVDRTDKKKVMLISDSINALITFMLFILLITDNLGIKYMYLAEFIAGAMDSFQIPANQVATTIIIPKSYYKKASSLRSISGSTTKILSPIFAGSLMALFGIKGIMIIDLITFAIAFTTLLLFVNIPKFKNNKDNINDKKSFYEEAKFGFMYIYEKRGLFWLLIFFIGINLIASSTYYSILSPMIMARSGNNELILGTIQSALGLGGVVGGIISVKLKGFDKKVYGILFSAGASFLIGDILIAVGNNVSLWCIAAFMTSFFLPFLMANETSLWQSKVDPNVQGRVFSIKGTVQMASMPIGFIIGGILADKVFEPSMMNEGVLYNIFHTIVGSGKGTGMAVMFFFAGILGLTLCLMAFLNSSIRNIENDIPDHQYEPETFI